MKKTIILATLCGIALLGCSKTSPLLENHKEFIGEWGNDNSTLVIKKDGEVQYKQHIKTEDKTASSTIKTSAMSDIKAPITEFDAQHFQVGQGSLSQNFSITQAPQQKDGKWQMVLNNQVYQRN